MQVRPTNKHTQMKPGGRPFGLLSATTLVMAVSGFFSPVIHAAPTVSGNIISWSDDGWYQVQRADDYESLCEGGTSCEVPAGQYNVINLTTGQRYEGVSVVGSDGVGQNEAILVDGYEISWPDDGWYQVQRADTYESLCQGGTSCIVPAGTYNVINLTTGERSTDIKVTGDEVVAGPLMLDEALPAIMSQLAGYEFERDVESLTGKVDGILSRAIGESEAPASIVSLESRLAFTNVPLSSVTYSCSGGGELTVGVAELEIVEYSFSHDAERTVYDFDYCIDQVSTYNGVLSIERGLEEGSNAIGDTFDVHVKKVRAVNFEEVVDEVWAFSMKGSVYTREVFREVAATNDDETIGSRSVDIARYITSTVNVKDVDSELVESTMGSGAVRSYALSAGGELSSDEVTGGQLVSARTESEFSRVIGVNRDGGFSLNLVFTPDEAKETSPGFECQNPGIERSDDSRALLRAVFAPTV